MLSQPIAEALDRFLAEQTPDASEFLALIQEEQQDCGRSTEDERQILEEEAEWLRGVAGENQQIFSLFPQTQLEESKKSLIAAFCEFERKLSTVDDLQSDLERMVAGLERLREGASPAEKLQSYLQSRKELLGSWHRAEWAVAAEDRLAAAAQVLHALLFRAFRDSPEAFFTLVLGSGAEPRTAQSFLLEFYTRLLEEALEGRAPLAGLKAYKTLTESAYDYALEDQLAAVSERVLEAKAALFTTNQLCRRANAEEFDRFLECAAELGFSALAGRARTHARVALHRDELDRLVTVKNLLVAFFERSEITGEEFLIAAEAIAPPVQAGEELCPAPLMQDYARGFYALLLFYLQRRLEPCAARLPRARFSAFLRRAVEGALGLPALFAPLAAVEFRWLRCAPQL